MEKRKKRGLGYLVALAVAGLLLNLAMANIGWGRAGGGQHFHSSGSHSHSSSHSSSSSSHSSSSSSSSHPYHSTSGSGSSGDGAAGAGCVGFFIFLLIVVVIIVIIAKSRKGSAPGAGLESSYPSPDDYGMPDPEALAANAEQSLADLKARDPNFSEQQFEDMASTAFYKVQEAWAARNMGMARAFISPAIFQRFEVQIAELKRNGQTKKMENLVVGSLDIVEAMHDGGFDYVTARIEASAADYTVDDKTGKIVSGLMVSQGFVEYWTFLRSDQVQTKANEDQIASQKCPNCGAPIKLNAVGKCDYCGSDITSGVFSWVLSEITQEGVWRPRSKARRPENVSPLAGGRYVLGLVQCPNCGANVQDIAGVTEERCWRCGGTVHTEK